MKIIDFKPEFIPFEGEGNRKILVNKGCNDIWCKAMSRSEYEAILKDPATKQRVEDYQSTHDAAIKRGAYGAFFLGDPSEESEKAAEEKAATNGGVKLYRHRKEDLVPSKFCYFDFDHCDPIETLNLILDTCILHKINIVEWIFQINVSFSGEGLRMITLGKPGSSIEEDQKWFCGLMGVEYDKVCKDISRNSFITHWDYLLFYNPGLGFTSHDFPYNETATNMSVQKAAEQTKVSTILPTTLQVGIDLSKAEYKGVAIYPNYYQEWIKQNPYKGAREQTAFDFASDFYRITDGNAELILQILLKESKSWEGDHPFTEAEVRQAVQSGVKNGVQTPMSKRMQKVINKVQAVAMNAEDVTPDDIPQLTAKLPPMLDIILSVVYDYQKPGLIPLVIAWMLTRVEGLRVKLPNGQRKPITLQSILLGESQSGKDAATILHKVLNADLIQKSEESNEARLQWMAEQKRVKPKDRKPSPYYHFPDLFENITGPMLRQVLYWHQNIGDFGKPCMVYVPELDKLYNLNKEGQQCNLADLIKASHDCDKLRSLRFTEESSSYSGTAAMQITASGQPSRAREIFKKNLVIDGTVGRIFFSSMFREEQTDYHIGEYTQKQKLKIQQYLDNLTNYHAEVDSDGLPKALEVSAAVKLHKEINADISEYSKLYNDKAYISYAYRHNEIVFRMIVVLYIANGCKWHPSFTKLYRWLFEYGMWNKMHYFGQTANEMLTSGTITAYKVKKQPLSLLPDTFTREQLAQICKQEGIKGTPALTVARWKDRKLVEVTDNPDVWTKTEKGKNKQ